ncbi:peptidylprolyl isomerase [Bacteroidia bacterium]|nr:peptidylprolyl isomerase [Bacteroidia bacterium]
MKNILKVLFFFTMASSLVHAQGKIMLDEIVVVVANKMIKHSDIEAQIANLKMQGTAVTDQSYCELLEQLMVTKLYENQAELDSLFVSETEVEANIDRRIRYFIQQIGSREKLESFYNKSVVAIKEEFREMIRSQMIAGQMENKITEDVRVTPNEVRQFFEQLPPDSVPLVQTEYEVSQIIKKPVITQAQKDATKAKLNEYRDRILKGERFSALAAFYSEDPGSAKKGGELGFFNRGEMYSEFESTAFSLKEGELSPVIETKAGFHILQLIERRGESVNVRHLLLQTQPSAEELYAAQKFLDSVAKLIRDSVHSFDEAAQLFSDDPSGRTGGLYTSPYSGNARMVSEEMEPDVFFIIDKFEIGQVSNASPMQNEDREQAMRILQLRNRTSPHKANLQSDYDKIYTIALNEAKQKAMEDWLVKKIKTTYIKQTNKAESCTFKYRWDK